MPDEPRYWFPAKRYGYGWGFPVTWQGWLVFAAYLIAILSAVRLIPVESHPVAFFSAVGVATTGLVLICWWKGEPPRWRWGN